MSNTSSPMGIAGPSHVCTVTVRGGTEAAAAYQRQRYGGLLCQPSKGSGGNGADFLCTFCGQRISDAKPVR